MPVVVHLPEIPEGKVLEEFVSAFYQVGGRYVERSIVQRETEEVLELDILVTDYDVSPPAYLLTEVKSGGWGFSDLFKLRGWLDYLHLDQAVFVATKVKDHLDFFRDKAIGLSIRLIVLPYLEDASTQLAEVTGTTTPSELDVAIWRFSHWLDRVLVSDLIHKKKSNPKAKRYLALADYLHAVNSGAFFRQTISERMYHLCSKYKEHPNISSRVAAEMKGLPFNGEYGKVDNEVFKQTFYHCDYNDLQISCFIEHRARLALMKYATDFLLFSKSGRMDIAKDVWRVKILGHDIELSSFESLPATFRSGMECIKNEPFFHRYPVFWQWFMWAYGGFILLDKKDEEYAHMAVRTGIPVDEIPRALAAYDVLFPTSESWFTDTSPNARILKLKMFPVPFMGLGAFYRRRIYCRDDDLGKLAVTGSYTVPDLARWNNATVIVLNK